MYLLVQAHVNRVLMELPNACIKYCDTDSNAQIKVNDMQAVAMGT